MAEFAQVVKDIQAGKFAPVYFLQGEEPFFIDNILGHIEKTALDDTQKSFNQYVLYGKDTSFEQVVSTARKYPMMGERQVVIVKEAQEMKGWAKEEDQKLLAQYLDNPLPSTILAFGYKYKTLDKRTKLGKTIDKQAVTILSKKLFDNQVAPWIKSYAKAAEVNITDGACMLMSENIGNNLERIANEIDKLLINVGPDRKIDENLVHRYVGISKEYNVFELQKAIGLGDHRKAMKIVHYFAENPKNNPLVLVLFNLYAYFSRMVLLMQAETSDENQLARIMGVNPFFVKEFVAAARLYGMARVLRNLEYIYQADLQSKGIRTMNMKEREVLTELIYKLMN
jgi:DNA polymerase-3 subunit delta